jgi:hypothetical protein
MKKALRRREHRTYSELENALGESLDWIKKEECLNYFRNSRYATQLMRTQSDRQRPVTTFLLHHATATQAGYAGAATDTAGSTAAPRSGCSPHAPLGRRGQNRPGHLQFSHGSDAVDNLPVKFDASRRTPTSSQEERKVTWVLNAAALTYVAATLTSMLTLVYFFFQAGQSSDE